MFLIFAELGCCVYQISSEENTIPLDLCHECYVLSNSSMRVVSYICCHCCFYFLIVCKSRNALMMSVSSLRYGVDCVYSLAQIIWKKVASKDLQAL